ncbi:hypothetical protein K8I85_08545 [bacterium]|nr:hypothetical protein [bacterium]
MRTGSIEFNLFGLTTLPLPLRWLLVVLLLSAAGRASANSLCLGPTEHDGSMGTVDCDQIQPLFWTTEWIGFAEDAAEACSSQCPPECNNDVKGGCRCGYQWSLSASATNPDVNVAALPADGWIYLWFRRDGAYGWPRGIAAAGFRLTGTLHPVAFEPVESVVLWLPELFPDILMAVAGCPDPPMLVGRIRVQDPSAVEARTWGRTKAAYR